jgi:hypothetical protein
MTKQWDRSQTTTNQSPALVILHQAIGPVPLPSLRCWVHIPRQLPVSITVRARINSAAAAQMVQGEEPNVEVRKRKPGLGTVTATEAET